MKRRNIMILMISLSLVLLLGSSYAMLRSTAVGTTPYVINVGSLQVSFEGSTDKLNLENMYPMSDQEGSNQSKELGFVVKNTGNIEARYNVYLEEISTDPEFKNYIRFISNKNSEGYNEPKTMGYDKYIDLEARLGVSESASYKVKVWLDKEAENDYMDKTFTAKVVIEGNQIDTSNTLYTKINNEITKHPGTTIEEDGVTYLSGSNTDVNYNYVWYSGKLWRITSINSDGTIKMITDNLMTTIAWGNDTNYENSWIREWLNEDFLDTLYNSNNLIVNDYSWSNTLTTDYTLKDSNPNYVKDAVGTLTIYEYYKAYQNTTYQNGFLFLPFIWYTMTPSDSQNIYIITSGGAIMAKDSTGRYPNDLAFGIRPCVNLKSDTLIIAGDGSKSNPFRLKGDLENKNLASVKLNYRKIGEYVKFDNKVYRIVSLENNMTKLIMNDYLRDSDKNVLLKDIADTEYYYGNDQNPNYWASYLNNTWYNSINEVYKKMLVKGTYYLGFYPKINSYKNTICKQPETKESIKECEKVDTIWKGYVGLSRAGEIFCTQIIPATNSIYIISPYSSTWIKQLYVHQHLGDAQISDTIENAVRPTITLDKNVIITSGEGTYDSPFEISCPSCNNT